MVAFLVRELMADEPVIDLRVFKLRSYATGVFLMTSLGFVLYGSLVLLPIMLQTLLGYPSFEAGIAMAPRGLGSLIGMPTVGLLIGRLDPRKLRGSSRLHRRRRGARDFAMRTVLSRSRRALRFHGHRRRHAA